MKKNNELRKVGDRFNVTPLTIATIIELENNVALVEMYPKNAYANITWGEKPKDKPKYQIYNFVLNQSGEIMDKCLLISYDPGTLANYDLMKSKYDKVIADYRAGKEAKVRADEYTKLKLEREYARQSKATLFSNIRDNAINELIEAIKVTDVKKLEGNKQVSKLVSTLFEAETLLKYIK